MKKKKLKLKLFVWEDFDPDYTSGLAFAIARTEAAARKKVVKVYGLEPSTWGTLAIYSLSKSVAFAVCGGG